MDVTRDIVDLRLGQTCQNEKIFCFLIDLHHNILDIPHSILFDLQRCQNFFSLVRHFNCVVSPDNGKHCKLLSFRNIFRHFLRTEFASQITRSLEFGHQVQSSRISAWPSKSSWIFALEHHISTHLQTFFVVRIESSVHRSIVMGNWQLVPTLSIDFIESDVFCSKVCKKMFPLILKLLNLLLSVL